MKTMNVRVLVADQHGYATKQHDGVKVDYLPDWLHLEDQHGDVVAYPAHAVLRVEAKPTSYDRGN